MVETLLAGGTRERGEEGRKGGRECNVHVFEGALLLALAGLWLQRAFWVVKSCLVDE